MMTGRVREGFVYGLIAYGSWGVVPLYFRPLQHISALEILAQRIVWSLLFLGFLLFFLRRWQALGTAVRKPWIRWTLLASALLVGCNWFLYITAITTHQVMQGSLGHFINPLVNVVLGMLFFRERLRPMQLLAVASAAIGVFLLTVETNAFPALALSLAFSFGFYGLLRKKLPVDGLVGLSVETAVLSPVALGYLVFLHTEGTLSLGGGDFVIDLLLIGSGVITAAPLLCFGQATQRLSLSALGFLQYLSPSLQFLLAVFVFGEEFDTKRFYSFAFIWAGLAIFTIDSVRYYRRVARSPALAPVPIVD